MMLAVLVALLLAWPGAARADDIGIEPVPVPATVLANAPGATALTGYAGHVVWSRLNFASGRWQLVQWHRGAVTVLPVAERSVPFDASAGPSQSGRPVVVFSQCRVDPPGVSGVLPTPDWGAASGCVLKQLSLEGGGNAQTIRRVGTGRSLTTPSVWRGSLVAVTRTPSGANARVLLWRRGAAAPVRLPGGSVPVCPFRACPADSMRTAVDALDLGPRSLVLDWRVTGGNVTGVRLGWELRTVSLATRQSTIVQFGYISGACGFHQPFAPGAAASGVATYVDAASACEGIETALARFDPKTELRREARPDHLYVFGAATDAATTYWLRGQFAPPSDDQGPPQLGPPCTRTVAQCQLVRSAALTYRRGRSGPDHPAVG